MITTRWFFTRSYFGPTANQSGVFSVIAPISGQYTGRIAVEPAGIDLTAVSYDSNIVSPSVIQADFKALKEASNIINPETPLSTKLSGWSKYAATSTALEFNLVDTRHGKGQTARDFIVRAARQMLVHQLSGRFYFARDLDNDTFGDLPLPVQEAYEDFMKFHKFNLNKLPAQSDSWRTVYRGLINNPPKTWERALDLVPRANMGHPEARLENNNG